MNNPLAIDDHLKLAHNLVEMMLEIIQADNSLGGMAVAERLSRLQEVVWPKDGKYLEIKAERRVFKEVLQGLNETQRTQLFEAYARMGHLYEIAGLGARKHFFSKQRKIPGGVAVLIENMGDADEVVAKLNQPVFEVVMTMHPTNTHSLESMQAQRELIKAVESADVEKAKQAMRMVLYAPVLHEKHGEDANFTVRDETAVIVHFLNNLYDDSTAVYKEYDDALRTKFLSAYKPEELNLQLKLGSWGSAGDKDGNSNVTAEATLEAIAMHTSAIVSRYKTDMEVIGGDRLASWKEKIIKAHTELKTLLPEIEQLRKDSTEARSGGATISGQELSDRFDTLSKKLVEVRKPLDAKDFEQDVQQEYARAQDKQVLDLLRKIRLFGFDFSKIEYRETAEEYGRVAAELMPGYKSMSPEKKVQELTTLLAAQNEDPQHLLGAVKDKIIAAANVPYSEESALPIAYHTMKRMELARDFPTMIKDNVLAECGRFGDDAAHPVAEVVSQGTSNILEAQLMQRMTQEKDGRTPKLGIVPLFEEPNTMMNIDAIMRSAYENKAYQQHLELMKDEHKGKCTQQVQIAHSDNARRSGLLAARAYIHEAHKKMRALNKEMGIETQFFEGGSISDAYRNGVRAVSASVNAFDLHDFTKFTFQGGDLVNYFTAPSSTVRLLSRNIAHAATRFEKDGDGWKIRNRSEENAESIARNMRKPFQLLDEIATEALKKTLTDYERDDFDKDKMGAMLAVIDYKGENRAGARGSRATERGKALAFANVDSTKAGIIKPIDILKNLKPIDIKKVRTISFSEAWQHAGIVPSWLGSKNLGKHLLEETKKHLDEIKASKNPTIRSQFGTISEATETLTPEQVQLFYERSPTFRDAQDRSAFAIAMTDPHSIEWIDKRLDLMNTMELHPGIVANGRQYLGHMRETHMKAAQLAHESLTGVALDGSPREAMTSALDRLTDDIGRKAHYRDFLLYAKIQGTSEHDRGVIHNAGDTVVHGRFLAADDPTYGEARLQQKLSVGAAAVRG